MLTFTSVTTVEFESMEDLESMVRQLPLEPHEIVNLLEGEEITDSSDQSDAPGAGATVHKFKITGKE